MFHYIVYFKSTKKNICSEFILRMCAKVDSHAKNSIVWALAGKTRKQYNTCEHSGGSIFLPILRVPSFPPVNFQNLPPVKKNKYNKILTYNLRSIFLEIPHLELPRWWKTPRCTNGKGECHIWWYPVIDLFDTLTGKLSHGD